MSGSRIAEEETSLQGILSYREAWAAADVADGGREDSRKIKVEVLSQENQC